MELCDAPESIWVTCWMQEATGLAAFRGGRGSVLVASDAATRGMDVPGVEVVVNYDAATYPKTYIHRAGRTARAGKEGGLWSIALPSDLSVFAQCYTASSHYCNEADFLETGPDCLRLSTCSTRNFRLDSGAGWVSQHQSSRQHLQLCFRMAFR